MNEDEIFIQLKVVVLDLDQAITVIRHEYGSKAAQMRDPNGRYLLLDALSAKANALAAMGQLEAQRGQ